MSDSRTPTLADVLTQLPTHELPPVVRRDMSSALRKVGVVLGRDLAEIPADPARLNARLQDVAHSAHGISKQRWANVRSLTLKAIGLVRPIMPGRRTTPMSDEWQTLAGRLRTKDAVARLGPLLRFLSAEGISPAEVTEADVLRYRDRLLGESLRRDPQGTWDSLLWQWNQAVREIEGFPKVDLPRESQRERKSLDENDFPPSLWEDRDRWLDRLQGKDILDDGPIRAVSDSTRRTRAYQILCFASALVRAGVSPDTLQSLNDLVELQNFEKGMRLLFDEKGRAMTSHLAGIGGALISIARHYVLPRSGKTDLEREAILRRLRTIVSRISPDRVGMTEKNHDRLMQFESEEAIGKFLNLPDVLRAKIASKPVPQAQKHALADVALALELLQVAPVRMGNLSRIRLDQNLIRHRDGYLLVFKEGEVKNRTRLQFKLPKKACDVIDWYLSDIRTQRIRGETDALFIGEDGISLKAQNTLASQIAKKVLEYTGLKFNAHLIRHLTSLMFLDQVPGGHHVLRLVLGHKSIETLHRAYTGAEAKSAHAHFDGVIRGLRVRHAQVKKRGRPPKIQNGERAKDPDSAKWLPDSGLGSSRRR